MSALINVSAIDGILDSLRRRDLTEHAAAGYVDGYVPLLRLFQEQSIEDAELVQAGAYAVYGWMPTMLKRPPSDEQAVALLAFIADCKGKAVPSLDRLSAVLRTVNGSVVGTSKFLHFALPDTFPIWDSVVAGAFGLRHPYQYSTSDAYCLYFTAARAWLSSGQTLPENFVAWLNGAPKQARVGVVRRLELALYLEGSLRGREA